MEGGRRDAKVTMMHGEQAQMQSNTNEMNSNFKHIREQNNPGNAKEAGRLVYAWAEVTADAVRARKSEMENGLNTQALPSLEDNYVKLPKI